jgi:sigma-B regulation protein RsbU (phosphoserine phosphatase)
MTIDPALLRRVRLFADLPEDELPSLAANLRERTLEAGALLFREGDSAGECFIVLDGDIAIIKALGTPDERLLGIRPCGTVVGELSLFSPGGQHTASVRAHTPLVLIEMSRAELDGLLVRFPSLTYALVQTLSLRLIESEQQTISDLRQKNDALAKAYQELQAAQAQLIEKERLERELEVARRIQRSLLPRGVPVVDGLDFGALMRPMSAVGGDFYDCMPLDGGRLGLAVGDVSDHGVPAALFMTMAVTLLRAAVRRGLPPVEVLRAVNRDLLEFNEAGMFVTVLYGVLDPASGEFHYARGGHEPPLVQTPRGPLPAAAHRRGQLLGIFNEPELDEQRVRLEGGGTLLLYTDGAREASDLAGRMFGEEGLWTALAHGPTDAQTLCDGLLEQVSAHRGHPQAQQDDITLLAVRAHPNAFA